MHRIPNNTSEIQSPCVHGDHTSLKQDDAVSRCFDKMTLNRRGFHGLLLVKVFEQGLRVVFDPRVFRRYVAPGDAEVVQDGVTVVTSGSRRSDWLATVMIMMMMTWCYVTWHKTTIHLHSDASRNYDGDLGDCLLLDLHVRYTVATWRHIVRHRGRTGTEWSRIR